jgi:hypothetical protein
MIDTAVEIAESFRIGTFACQQAHCFKATLVLAAILDASPGEDQHL